MAPQIAISEYPKFYYRSDCTKAVTTMSLNMGRWASRVQVFVALLIVYHNNAVAFVNGPTSVCMLRGIGEAQIACSARLPHEVGGEYDLTADDIATVNARLGNIEETTQSTQANDEMERQAALRVQMEEVRAKIDATRAAVNARVRGDAAQKVARSNEQIEEESPQKAEIQSKMEKEVCFVDSFHS